MLPRVAWIFAAALALLVAIMGVLRLSPRMAVEAEHKNVVLALDFQQLYTLSHDEGFDLEPWLLQLKAEGFDHLAVSEDTPLWLEQRGLCTVVEGFQITKSVPQKDLHHEGGAPLLTPEQQKAAKAKEKPEINYAPAENAAYAALDLPPGDLHLLFPREAGGGSIDAMVYSRAAMDRLGPERVALNDLPDDGLVALSLKGDVEELVNMGLGFDSGLERQLRGAGFVVIPRLRN
ncbi:MAG: DUF5693 family protein, partial [bacterium]